MGRRIIRVTGSEKNILELMQFADGMINLTNGAKTICFHARDNGRFITADMGDYIVSDGKGDISVSVPPSKEKAND